MWLACPLFCFILFYFIFKLKTSTKVIFLCLYVFFSCICILSMCLCMYIQGGWVIHVIFPQTKNNPILFLHCHFLDHDSRRCDEVRKRINPKQYGYHLWTTGERTDTSNYKYVARELSITNLILLRAKPDFN